MIYVKIYTTESFVLSIPPLWTASLLIRSDNSLCVRPFKALRTVTSLTLRILAISRRSPCFISISPIILLKIFVSLASLSKSKATKINPLDLKSKNNIPFQVIFMLNIAKIRKKWFIEQLEDLKEKGTPYTEIAASLGVKPQYLNSIKNTEKGASENLTIKLCETFNINYNGLLERIRTYKEQDPETPKVNKLPSEISSKGRLPLHEKALDGNNKGNEWIDIGELFPKATSAIRHYGDSMEEYPSGAILILKRIINPELIIWGRNYYVETKEIAVTKRLQDGGDDYIIGYSSNLQTYPDGRLIHEPVKIPRKEIHHIYLILGCVTKEFEEGVIPTSIHTV